MVEDNTKTPKLKRRQKKETAEEGISKKSRLMKRERVNIGVSINSELWRKLRALAITHGRLTGELIDEALEKYLINYEKKVK
jgi:hypothetical protein